MAKKFRLSRSISHAQYRGRILTNSYSDNIVKRAIEHKNRQLNTVIILLSVAIFISIISTIFVLGGNDSEEDAVIDTTAVIDALEEDPYVNRSFERPDYENLDFYSALYNIGLELNDYYIDLVLYQENPESGDITLVGLKERRDLIYTTVDDIIRKDIDSNNSALVGTSQGILESLDTSFHYIDQIVHFLETDISQANSYYYTKFKDGLDLYLQYLYALLEEQKATGSSEDK